ncbi:unnamed protein product [Rotaria socialis]|uniref:YLP motif-containing protein 1 n=3 Tax=Rotaria socialis TaxID=392032 RepID=A0A817U734_9BILA|nr:unnamed protein product [Rotaria socialis]CAF3322982.1 unnamed protein product [Rotaria socialis]CAF3516549.1 unnamed protein product [Rotaria socialis]CAF3785678.1 unnamed protein product [Rotaria socialis]CAF4218592.1 unnamed protein product [Rotaria socialis]
MIPYRGDRFDHFNNGQPVNRHMVPFPQQQQPQIVQPQSIMYSAPTYQFRQSYLGNMPMQQQTLMFVQSRPRPQQSWILSSGPPQSAPFMSPSPPTFNQIQPPLPPQQQSFSGGINIQQPSFSGGTGVNHPPFSGGFCMPQSSFSGGGNNVSQPLLNCGTGIPQPSFSGGTGVLKRKSHYLEESDYDLSTNSTHDNNRELPSLMNISTQSYNNNQPQQKHHFQHANSRYMGNTNTILRLPPTPQGSCMPPPPPTESFNNRLPHPHWTNSDRNMYPMPPQLARSTQREQQQQQVLTSQLFQKHQLISIDTLLKEPGRLQRPGQLIIFLRGLPGSGKSYVAELIKNEEELNSKGTNKPKILSIDNYFLNENQLETKDPKTGKITKTSVMEYEYDAKMEETYRRNLIKLVRKSIDDRFYPFLIVDQNNEQTGHFRDMADYAEANQFQVYFVELNNDIQICAQRNIHSRSSVDIEQIHKRWEQLPLRYEILDIRSLLQSDAIDEVEMDDAPSAATTTATTEQNDAEEEESQITKKSKWEAMMETNLDRLDGVYQRRNVSSSPLIEKYSNNTTGNIEEQPNDLSPDCQSRKKKVRWADVEESALHLHKKAVGFVVGQTEQDWQRMSDDYDPSKKLNQYKYI